MKHPTDTQLEKLLEGFGIKTDNAVLTIDKDVLLSVLRKIYWVANFKEGS